MKRLITTTAIFLSLIGCGRSERFVQVAEEALQKTVTIHVTGSVQVLELTFKDGKFVGEQKKVKVMVTGAGVFVSSNGHILTANHLFELTDITGITVTQHDGTMEGAEILAQDVRKDLALLQISGPTPHFATIADPRKLRVGQEVLAVGSPLGLDLSVSHGIISALNRDFDFRYNATQSDAFINPGNSGGPLFNMDGELVGINSFVIPPIHAPIFTGLGFSTSCGQIIEFITRVRQKYEGLPGLKWKP